jgi:hypothetical protein
MPFEAFLGETHARPLRGRAIGYAASLVLHGPPVTAFVIAWLMHSLVIGHHDLPNDPHARLPFWVPVALWSHQPGAPGEPGGAPGADRGRAEPRAGGAGLAHGRRSRITQPRHAAAAAAAEPRPEGAPEYRFDGFEGPNDPEVTSNGPGGLGGTGDGIAGAATGSAGASAGDGAAAAGTGVGGPGGGTDKPGALLATKEEERPASRPAKREGSGASSTAGAGPGAAGEGGPGDGQPEEEREVQTAPGQAPVRASYLSERMASYFRTYESYPRLPEWCYDGGRTQHSLLLEICVATDGSVSNVNVKQGTLPEVNQIVSEAIRSWHYRPRMVAGLPRPFCHPIKIQYSKQLRPY